VQAVKVTTESAMQLQSTSYEAEFCALSSGEVGFELRVHLTKLLVAECAGVFADIFGLKNKVLLLCGKVHFSQNG
jgi:hypothetical protein